MSAAEIAFWGPAALVGYTYLGYPLVLSLLARVFPARFADSGGDTPEVTLLIVAHNEEGRIGAKLENCLALDYPQALLEVIVASDGSTDGTEAVVRGFAPRGVRLVALPGPNGKPMALNRVVPEARGAILVLADARQTLEPSALRALVSRFQDPRVGAVSGELHLRSSGSASVEGVGAYWRYEKWIRRAEAAFDSTVGATGAFYAVRRALFRPLDPRTILDDVAIPMDVVLAGSRVLFEPAARAFDDLAESGAREFARKVRTLAGNIQLVFLRPDLLVPWRNRLLFQFVSHKLLRLAVPWCLLLMLASSVLASGVAFYGACLALQAVVYALALLGWRLERIGVHLRLLSVPYAFALLNVAALVAPFILLLGRTGAAWKQAA